MSNETTKSGATDAQKVIAALVVGAALLGSAFLISQTRFNIKSDNVSANQEGKFLNAISVSGEGKVFAKPDMVICSFTISETKSTSKAALQEVNNKIGDIKKILEKKGIDKKDIQTAELSIYPDYEWTGSKQILKGQRATQRLEVKIKKVDISSTKASEIIDEVAKIDNVQIGNIIFDIEDKEPFFSEARKLAVKKAKQKASEIANETDVKLLKPISISDVSVNYTPVYRELSNYAAKDMAGTNQQSTDISSGQLEITISLNVSYGIDNN